jgi:hypothetical protein
MPVAKKDLGFEPQPAILLAELQRIPSEESTVHEKYVKQNCKPYSQIRLVKCISFTASMGYVSDITINVPLFKKLRDIIFFFAGQSLYVPRNSS